MTVALAFGDGGGLRGQKFEHGQVKVGWPPCRGSHRRPFWYHMAMACSVVERAPGEPVEARC